MPQSRRSKSPPTPADLQTMFEAAEKFREAGEHMYATIPMPNVLRFLPPKAVLSALSLEIYLKCLVLLAGNSYGTIHDLLELYRSLDQETRDRISQLYAPHAEVAQAIIDHHHRNVLGREGEPPRATIEFVLNSCRHAFENFRYYYEPGKFRNGEGWSGDAIVASTRTAILEIKPEWANRSDQPRFLDRVYL